MKYYRTREGKALANAFFDLNTMLVDSGFLAEYARKVATTLRDVDVENMDDIANELDDVARDVEALRQRLLQAKERIRETIEKLGIELF